MKRVQIFSIFMNIVFYRDLAAVRQRARRESIRIAPRGLPTLSRRGGREIPTHGGKSGLSIRISRVAPGVVRTEGWAVKDEATRLPPFEPDIARCRRLGDRPRLPLPRRPCLRLRHRRRAHHRRRRPRPGQCLDRRQARPFFGIAPKKIAMRAPIPHKKLEVGRPMPSVRA